MAFMSLVGDRVKGSSWAGIFNRDKISTVGSSKFFGR